MLLLICVARSFNPNNFVPLTQNTVKVTLLNCQPYFLLHYTACLQKNPILFNHMKAKISYTTIFECFFFLIISFRLCLFCIIYFLIVFIEIIGIFPRSACALAPARSFVPFSFNILAFLAYIYIFF